MVRLCISEKYEAITEVESGTKPLKVTKKMMFLEIQY